MVTIYFCRNTHRDDGTPKEVNAEQTKMWQNAGIVGHMLSCQKWMSFSEIVAALMQYCEQFLEECHYERQHPVETVLSGLSQLISCGLVKVKIELTRDRGFYTHLKLQCPVERNE